MKPTASMSETHHFQHVQQQERSAVDPRRGADPKEGGPRCSFRCQEPSRSEVQVTSVSLCNSLLPCVPNSAKSANGTTSAVMTWRTALTCSQVGSTFSKGSAPRSLTWKVNVSQTLACGRRASSESNAGSRMNIDAAGRWWPELWRSPIHSLGTTKTPVVMRSETQAWTREAKTAGTWQTKSRRRTGLATQYKDESGKQWLGSGEP